MCEKCAELDRQIEQCQRLVALISDKFSIDGIEVLLQSCLDEKLKLHSAPWMSEAASVVGGLFHRMRRSRWSPSLSMQIDNVEVEMKQIVDSIVASTAEDE